MIYYQIDFNDVLALACHVAYVKYHVVSCPFRNRGFVTVVNGSVSKHYQKLSGESSIMLPNGITAFIFHITMQML